MKTKEPDYSLIDFTESEAAGCSYTYSCTTTPINDNPYHWENLTRNAKRAHELPDNAEIIEIIFTKEGAKAQYILK